MKNVIKEFDKKFTRKSKGLEDKGKFRDDWFIKDYITSKEVKDFILKVQKDTKDEILKKIEGMKRTKQAELKSEREIVKRDNYFYNKALQDLKEIIK